MLESKELISFFKIYMAFLEYPFNVVLATLLQHFDNICRKDLEADNIVSERDYVSNLATHIRYPIGPLLSRLHSPFTTISAITSPGIYEQQLGGDGIIVISANINEHAVKHKVGLFEAKWPRLFGGSKHFYKPTKTGRKPSRTFRWDSWKKRKDRKSRFSSQIELQKIASKMGFAVWEQFINEQPNGLSEHNFASNGSTCVLHGNTIAYMNDNPELYTSHINHRRWNNTDLLSIIKYGVPLKDIILLMCECNIGSLFDEMHGRLFIPVNIDAENLPETSTIRNRQGVTIPLPNGENKGEILEFMRDYGISFYSHFNLTNSKLRPFLIDEFLNTIL